MKSVSDLSSGSFPLDTKYVLMNKDTGHIYDMNDIVIKTDIRNATGLILISL